MELFDRGRSKSFLTEQLRPGVVDVLMTGEIKKSSIVFAFGNERLHRTGEFSFHLSILLIQFLLPVCYSTLYCVEAPVKNTTGTSIGTATIGTYLTLGTQPQPRCGSNNFTTVYRCAFSISLTDKE
jgi:hypothetical protein